MKLKLWLGAGLVLGVFGLALWGYLMGQQERLLEREIESPLKAPSRVVQKNGAAVIVLEPNAIAKGAIVTEPLAAVTHQRINSAYGIVLSTRELIELRRAYIEAGNQLQKAQSAATAGRKEFERVRTLHADEQNLSTQTLETAEAAWQTAAATMQIAQATLDALTQTARQQWGPILTRLAVDATPRFKRLTQQQEVLIQATLPAGVAVDSAAGTATLHTARGKSVTARILSAAPQTEPSLQGASFFLVAPAAGLVPGMTVMVDLPVAAPENGVLIPANAVIWWQGKAWAYVESSAGVYQRRAVPDHNPMSGGWFSAADFTAQERIVKVGAQLLFSEEFRSSVQVGETGPG